MLRNLAPTAESLLRRIYNKCWLEVMFPERWHRALLLPFLKPNKPPQLPSSYRPIALTSFMCKVLERIVNMRLTYFLETPRYMWMTLPFTSLDRTSPLQNGYCRLQWIGSPGGLCNMVSVCLHRRPLVFISTGNEMSRQIRYYI